MIILNFVYHHMKGFISQRTEFSLSDVVAWKEEVGFYDR